MSVAAWVFMVVALLAIAAFVIVLVLYIRKPTPDAKLLKAIDDATKARVAADAREHELSTRIAVLRKGIDSAVSIRDERERLAALARLANTLRGR